MEEMVQEVMIISLALFFMLVDCTVPRGLLITKYLREDEGLMIKSSLSCPPQLHWD